MPDVLTKPVLTPPLKWAGGKRWQVPHLRPLWAPHAHRRLVEPFCGGLAVSLGLLPDRAVLNDTNPHLVSFYRWLKKGLTIALPMKNDRTLFYECRDRFNDLLASGQGHGLEAASLFYYLNRTGYNGLFRLNASGEFNVPPGRYDSPKVIDRPLLTRVSEVLASPGIRIEHAAFDRVLQEARAGDFVYFDPPYAPLSATANFRGYTGRGFSDADQERLQQALITLARRGAQVLLSNSVAPSISRLYEGNDEAAAAGLQTWRFPARRAINSRPDRRGAVEELVVSNIRPQPAAS